MWYVLQSCTNSENVLVGSYGETFPGSHDANKAMNIKAEEASDSQEDRGLFPRFKAAGA
jgi:hypothetical protein